MYHVSIILPIYNEANSIISLFEEISKEMELLKKTYEIIMVNDGSHDQTEKVINDLSEQHPRIVKTVHLNRNFGQTAALSCGIDHSQGDVLITMDSDGQNSPKDFGSLLKKIDEGYEMVSGFRKNRKDRFFRVFLSKAANLFLRKYTKTHIKDLGCSLKAYRSYIFKRIKIYGEMHRLLPIYVAWMGYKYINVPVSHLPRKFGKSHYGFSRVYKVMADLWFLYFYRYNWTKPIYFFWKMSLFPLIFAFVSFILYIYKWIVQGDGLNYYLPIIFLLFIFALILVCLGILAEILIRIYYESQNKTIYLVKNKSPNLEKHNK